MSYTFNPFTGTLDILRDPAPVPGPHEWTHVQGGADDIDTALNPEAYPMLAGLAANRPVVGVPGRSYYSTDTLVLERDNGLAWVEMARGEAATRLAQLVERAHGSLTGIGANDHHPQLHAAEHEDGGGDEIDVGGLSGLLADQQDPLPHAGRHENGGVDEIDVGGLSGLLADPQPPLAHKDTHDPQTGTDPLDCDIPTGNVAEGAVAAEGVGDELTRVDHVHGCPATWAPSAHKDSHDPQTGGDALDCAAPPANITPEQANAEGAADTLARSDHMHYLPSGAPSTVGLANAEGAAAAFARQDHVHQREHARYTNAEAKAAAIAGWTASRALQVNAGGSIVASLVTLAELGYLDGVTSAIQTQLDAKVAKALFEATTFLYATLDNTPEAKTPAEVLAVLTAQAGATFSWNDQILSAVKGLLNTAETELTIAAGAITVTQMRHKVDTEGDAASDDLDTINGGATVNLIILRAESDARTVVVKHNTGNIWLQGKADISLDDLEDSIMLAWDSTNSKWFDIAAGGGAGIPTKIEDGTTKFEVESTDGPLVGTVAGVEAFRLSDVGILDLAKQSAVRAYRVLGDNQILPDSTICRIQLDNEDYDIQNEFDSSVVSGTADGTAANKLIDAGAFTEVASYYVGREVWNTTDETYAEVTAKDSDDQLALDANIMVNGEVYELYFSRFTATQAGRYLIVARNYYCTVVDQKVYQCRIHKNGAELSTFHMMASGINSVMVMHTVVAGLAVNDYIELYGNHTQGANATVRQTEMSIYKLG